MKKLMMAVMVAALGLSATAAYTPSFAYQGVLRDQLGARITAENVGISFKIYKSSSGTDYLWSKDYTVSLDTNGLFNVELTGAGANSSGVSTTLDKVAAANSNEDLYIGLTVAGSSGEITPRQKLIPAPRALFAHNVQKADGDFAVNGNLSVAGSISMSGANDTMSAANVWATGTLYAQQAATFGSDAQIGGNLTVVGNTTIGAADTTTEIKGDASVAGTLTVGGMSLSMPIGAIVMWSGSSTELPKDGCWALCDGKSMYPFNGDTNNMRPVPDLRGRFIVGTVGDGTDRVSVEGYDVTYATGETGGEMKHALTADEMPSHTHNLKFGQSDKRELESGSGTKYMLNSSGSSSRTSESAGQDQAHENRPPYYALCFIIKVK